MTRDFVRDTTPHQATPTPVTRHAITRSRTMTPRPATPDHSNENDLLIRRSRDRNPPGSFELGRYVEIGEREKVRECPRCATTKPASAFGTRVRRGKRSAQPYCRDCMVSYHAAWRATPDGHAKFAAAEKASKGRYPERDRARGAVCRALKAGTFERGPCCLAHSLTSCRGPIEAHHDDYGKPLEVRWVCRRHHRQLDRERRESGELVELLASALQAVRVSPEEVRSPVTGDPTSGEREP